mmetsp:Transcript_7797/g.8530  ORF Transcript_7797/g.8530 Transcript_7797/m.8530 type:complete len:215 (-) Transcript_7797:397-1041(-)
MRLILSLFSLVLLNLFVKSFPLILFSKELRKFHQVASSEEGKDVLSTLKKNLPVLTRSIAMSLLSSTIALSPIYAKQLNLADREITAIIEADITERQALNTADFTRDIYDESCRFQDEIDIYPLEQYVKGTKALFNAKKSHVDLTSPVIIDGENPRFIRFQFKEDLAFNFPILQPIVTLSGKVTLERDEKTGLIIYSREQWDQSIKDILATTHF